MFSLLFLFLGYGLQILCLVNNLIKISLSILFLLCLLDWDYSFYQFVRFVGMIGFIYLSYQQYKKNETWFYIWLVSAILINPIFKIFLTLRGFRVYL